MDETRLMQSAAHGSPARGRTGDCPGLLLSKARACGAAWPRQGGPDLAVKKQQAGGEQAP